MSLPPALPPGWTAHTSRSTGSRYYHSESLKKSVWCDDQLPAGWGFVREGEHAPKLYYHLATGQTAAQPSLAQPPAAAGAAAVAAAAAAAAAPAPTASLKRSLHSSDDQEEEHAAKAPRAEGGASGGSSSSSSSGGSGGGDGGGGGGGGGEASGAPAPAAPALPPPRAHDASRGDSPLLALARQEWLSWHHRKLAAAVAAHWPLAGDSKTLKACRADGLLPGLQGLHARLLFGQRDVQQVEVDALVPYAPSAPDKDTVKELVGSGMKEEVAGPLVAKLCVEMGKAAANLGVLYAELVTQADSGGGGGAPPQQQLLPAHGTVSLLPLRARAPHLPPQLLVVFEPSPAMARRYLAPLRAAAPLPATPLYGPLAMPLYAAAASAEAAAALAAAGLPPSPFTAVLPLNLAHFAKLALLYRLAAAGVSDPAALPAPGAPGCLRDATRAPAAPECSAAAACTPQRAAFLQRLFCVLARYEAFSGNSGGMQGAVPHGVFDALEAACGVSEECFASPLNCHFPRFCSAFPDTDAPFGSRGSFFEAAPREGAFQANPPFVNGVMKAMARRLAAQLEAARGAGKALLYFVIVPSWTDAYYHTLLAESPFRVASDRLARKQHEFIDGLQHRAGRCTWGANVDSSWFLLATPAAVARHGLGAGTAAQLGAAFAQTAEGLGEEQRVFKYR